MANNQIKSTRTTTTTAPKMSRARKNETRHVDFEAVARSAYERFLARGGQHGHDVEDWLAAERELSAR